MSDENQQTGQQGYGQDQDPTKQQKQQQPPLDQQQNPELGQTRQDQGTPSTSSEGGSVGGQSSTGQASYGNSGQTDQMTDTEHSPSFGQEPDIDSSNQDSSSFIGSQGSSDDIGAASQQDTDEQDEGSKTDNMSDDVSSGTTDIEIERSQGRESDIEGSSL